MDFGVHVYLSFVNHYYHFGRFQKKEAVLSSHTGSRKEYIVIFVVLALLTAIEIWAAQCLKDQAKLWGLIVLAVVKAGCVGVFYMHLKLETKWLRFIAVIPVVMGFYVYALSYEVMYR